MGIRRYTPSDHSLVASWWEGHSWPPIPAQFLSTTGFIVENHAFGFLYTTDSAIAWIEWVCTNPASDKMERDKALNLLIETLLNEARHRGASAVFTSSSHPGLSARLERHNFNVTDKNVTHFVKAF